MNKKYLFLDNIYNMYILESYFFPFILFNQFVFIFIIVLFNKKKLIVINKFSKYNRVNVSCPSLRIRRK